MTDTKPSSTPNCTKLFMYRHEAILVKQDCWTPEYTDAFLIHSFFDIAPDEEIMNMQFKYQFTIEFDDSEEHVLKGTYEDQVVFMIKPRFCELTNGDWTFYNDTLDDADFTVRVNNTKIRFEAIFKAYETYKNDTNLSIDIYDFLTQVENSEYLLMQHLQNY